MFTFSLNKLNFLVINEEQMLCYTVEGQSDEEKITHYFLASGMVSSSKMFLSSFPFFILTNIGLKLCNISKTRVNTVLFKARIASYSGTGVRQLMRKF